jgi:hypothetical protein
LQGVTIVSLWFAERRFSASQQHLFEEQFDAQIAIFDKSREKRFEALSSRLEEIAKRSKTCQCRQRRHRTRSQGDH